MACDLNFVNGEGLCKVTGSHVHWNGGIYLGNGAR